VQRIEDPHHPRGYRELRSLAEMRKLLNRKIVEQNGICPICEEKFTDYADVVPDHKQCKGMGGAWRDDHRDNIQATHWCAMERKDQPECDDRRVLDTPVVVPTYSARFSAHAGRKQLPSYPIHHGAKVSREEMPENAGNAQPNDGGGLAASSGLHVLILDVFLTFPTTWMMW